MKIIDKKYFKNPKMYIPEGGYCYSGQYKCPFWDRDRSKPEQVSGYCHYLKRGDWENEHFGLLWDSCKECGVKDYSKWCLDCEHFTYIKDYEGKCDVIDETVEGEDYCDKFIPKKELMG